MRWSKRKVDILGLTDEVEGGLESESQIAAVLVARPSITRGFNEFTESRPHVERLLSLDITTAELVEVWGGDRCGKDAPDPRPRPPA